MKLMEEYIIRKSYKVWSWFIAYALFFILFWDRIKSLNAGGVLFVYECMIIVFVLRYIRQYLYIRTAKMMDKDVEGKSFTVNLFFWSASTFNQREVLILELRPMIILTVVQILAIAISHFVFSAEFVTPILFGALVLSLAIYNQTYLTLFRCLKHPMATYKYGSEAFKVYSDKTLCGWPTSEKLINTILRGH